MGGGSERSRSPSKEAGSAHYCAMERQELQSWWSITDHPLRTQILVPRNGEMYQDPTEKSVETKREILQRTFNLLGGELYTYLVGKYSPPQKILADPLF